jgi:hypothetical protein
MTPDHNSLTCVRDCTTDVSVGRSVRVITANEPPFALTRPRSNPLATGRSLGFSWNEPRSATNTPVVFYEGSTVNYLRSYSSRSTPQSEKIPGSTQVENSADGFAWEVDHWTRLRRFLILGSEGGSYYASERKLTHENAEAVRLCIADDGPQTVAEIVAVSIEGRAPKNDPAIFALAMAASADDENDPSRCAERVA